MRFRRRWLLLMANRGNDYRPRLLLCKAQEDCQIEVMNMWSHKIGGPS